MAFDAHVAVGGGHFDACGNQAYDGHVAVGGGHIDNQYNPGGYTYDNVGVGENRTQVGAIFMANVTALPILRTGNDDSQAWLDRQQDQLDRTWDMAKEAGLMVGAAKAGDIDGTLEHGLNAALKSAEIQIENWKNMIDDGRAIFQHWFGVPDRDK